MVRTFYDIETFPNYFLIVAQEEDSEDFIILENPSFVELLNFIGDRNLIGFNNHHFDDIVLSSLIDYVQIHNLDMNIPIPPYYAYYFGQKVINKTDDKYMAGLTQPTEDIRKYMILSSHNISLKAYENALGMNIMETEHDFHSYLDDEGKKDTIDYCKNDVIASKKVFKFLQDFGSVDSIINLRKFVAGKIGVEPEALMKNSTNTMTIKLLERQDYDRNVFFELIKLWDLKYAFSDTAFVKWFNKIILYADDELKLEEPILNFTRNNVEWVFAKGGCHGYNTKGVFKDVVIKDGESFYPRLLISLNAFGDTNTKLFEEIVNTRLKAKAKGDKGVANSLKIVINSVYGITRSTKSGGKIYEKHLGLDVCILGQVCLYDLSLRIEEVGGTLVNINTDGIFYTENGHGEEIDKIIENFIERTGIGIGSGFLPYYFALNVNNYFALDKDYNVIKKKGIFNGQLFSNNLATPKYIMSHIICNLKGETPPTWEELYKSNKEDFILRGKKNRNGLYYFGYKTEYIRYSEKTGKELRKRGIQFLPLVNLGRQFRGYAVKKGYYVNGKNLKTNKFIEDTTLKTKKLKAMFHTDTTFENLDLNYYKDQVDEILEKLKI